MSQKPDHYAVLGVQKNASEDEIKKAFRAVAMKCHPDMLRNKTEDEKKAAAERFKNAKEANEVLTDKAKREAYDRGGHDAVENMRDSGSFVSTAPPPSSSPPRKMPTTEGMFDFFEKAAEKIAREAPSDGKPRETPEQRAARAAEERRKNRDAERARNQGTSVPAPAPAAPDAFREASEKVTEASSRLRHAEVPLDALQRFRDNLQDFIKEVDKAIDRARKNDGGPKF